MRSTVTYWSPAFLAICWAWSSSADGVAVDAGALGRAAAGDGRHLIDQRVDLAPRGLPSPPAALIRPAAMPCSSSSKRLEQMRRRDPLMMLAHRDRLRRLQEPAGAVGQFLKIHQLPLDLG